MMIRALILVGMLTTYSHPYVGGPLRCGSVNGASPLYDTTHAWIAVDIDAYPQFRCGDLVQVNAGGIQLLLRIGDSGPLSRFAVCDNGECVEIVGDIPAHSWPFGDSLSVKGAIENLTGGLRKRLEVER